MIHTLKNTGSRIDKVFHLADIHIRLQSRFDEYQKVFDSLYAVLRREQRPSVIVIAGDILHSKTELSPECILLTTDFFRSLSSIFPTFVIMGNHDALLNNPDRIDSLSAIVRDKHLPGFHYLLNSGYYRYENLLFGVSSLRDGEFMDGNIDCPGLVRIALYHGGVDRFFTNKGFEMNGSISCSDFQHYDYVMLGDIHKHQYLRPNIAYSGSLISQNFGETDPDHGLIEWDLVDETGRFLPIENEHAHQECLLEDNRILFMDRWYDLTDDIPFCRFARLRINTADESWLYAHKTLKERYPTIHSFIHMASRIETKKEETDYRSDETDEKKIIERFCLEKISDETERRDILQRILDHIHLEKRSDRGGEWTLVELSFDNMFGYGENNVIRFKDTDQSIIGILGCNSAGKSTLIDILCFALYGRITRQSTIPRELIHVKKRRFRCHVVFRIGSTEYKIEKWGQLDKKDRLKKIEEKFYEIRDGQTRDLTDEDRLKTDRKQIISKIGDMDQFLFTTVCLQNRERSFRDMTQKDRKEFLYGLLHLDWFEDWNKELNQSLQIMKKESAHLESRIRSCPEKQIRETLSRLRLSLEREQESCERIQRVIDHDQLLASSLTKEIIAFDSKYKKMNRLNLLLLLQSIDDDDEENFQTHDIWEDKDYVQGLHRSIHTEHTLDPVRYAEYKKYHDLVMTFDPSESIREEETYDRRIRDLYDRCKITRIDHEDDSTLEERIAKYKPWDKEECLSVLSLWNECDTIASELKKTPTDRVDWNMDCPQCVQNPYRHREETIQKEYLEKKTVLKKKRQQLRSRLQKLGITDKTLLENLIRERDRSSVQDEIGIQRDRQTLEDYRWIREAREVEQEKKTRLEEYYRYLTHKKDLVLYKTYVDMYENNEEVIRQNRIIRKELDDIREYEQKRERHRSRLDRQEIIDTLSYLDKKERLDGIRLDAHQRRYNESVEAVYRIKNEIEQYTQKLEQHDRDRLEYDQMRSEYNKTRQIHSLIQRDGLPLYILQQYVPVIEERINRLLTRFLDRHIRFCIQDDDIVMTLMVDNKSLNYFGGMESFIVDITTKIVLSQIAVFPRCNLFIIDEGISALDKEHIRSLHVLFEFLSRNFPQTWIISHLEIQDMFDRTLSIRKDKEGYSHIEM
jgi:DNA repair exonuclease SbcCD ATPase subunit